MELLIIGLCLGYLLGGMNNTNKVGCIRRTGPETGGPKPRFKEGSCRLGGTRPLSNTPKPKLDIRGTKPKTFIIDGRVIIADEIIFDDELQPPTGGSNINPPPKR